MIPFVLKNLCRIKCFVLFLFLFAPCLYAQPDTVYVYEYVRMVDTVWVETPINCSVDSIPFVPLVGNDLGLDARSAFDRSCVDSLFQKKCAALFHYSILNEENQYGTEMKKCTIGGLALCTFITTAQAQEPQGRWGFYLKGNLATQIQSYAFHSFYEELVELGVYTSVQITTRKSLQEQNARTLGAGARYAYRLNKHWALVGNAGYIQKGCSYDGSINYSNIFHHLNVDVVAQYRLPKKRFIDPYVYAGLEGNCRVEQSISYHINRNFGYQTETTYSGFNRFNSAYIAGLGLECARKYFVELEFRHDLGYLVRNEILEVQNQLVSLNVGFYLGKSPKYRLVLGE
jgi:hypothetical protein